MVYPSKYVIFGYDKDTSKAAVLYLTAQSKLELKTFSKKYVELDPDTLENMGGWAMREEQLKSLYEHTAVFYNYGLLSSERFSLKVEEKNIVFECRVKDYMIAFSNGQTLAYDSERCVLEKFQQTLNISSLK